VVGCIGCFGCFGCLVGWVDGCLVTELDEVFWLFGLVVLVVWLQNLNSLTVTIQQLRVEEQIFDVL